jgi:hypothetical protein
MKLHKLALLMGALAFTACDDGSGTDTKVDTGSDSDTGTADTDDTDDTDMMACYDDGTAGEPYWNFCEYDEAWEDALTFDCANNAATLAVRTSRWGFGATLYIAETRFTKDWDEEHTLSETSQSGNPEGWSFFEVTLETDTDIADVDDGKSLFNCADGDLDPANTDNFQTTFALVTYTDATQATVADCVVFGQDPQSVIDNSNSGTLPGGSPSWVTSDCTIIAGM